MDSTIYILERAREGDSSAARILIERAVPPVKRWAHGRLPRWARRGEDTEDLVQEAVLQTLKRLDAFEHRTVGSLRAYLREAVLNRIRDAIRQATRRGSHVEPAEDLQADSLSPLEQTLARERTERYLTALRKLSPDDRLAVVCRLELGCSFAEVADRLGIANVDTARMRVTRAVKRLAAEIGVKA